MTQQKPAVRPSDIDVSLLSKGLLYESKFDKLNTTTVGLAAYGLVLVLIIVIPLLFAGGQPGPVATAFSAAIFSVAITVAIVSFFVMFLKVKRLESRYAEAADAFAMANNFAVVPAGRLLELVPPSLRLAGAYERAAKGYQLVKDGNGIVVFDYTFSVGSGKQRRNYRFAVSVLTLSKLYPHIYLDGKANGSGYIYSGSQKVSLEGDFDKYFTLYIPADSAAGALAVLSPDMMRTLIDQGRQYDIEVYGRNAALITGGRAFTRQSFGVLLAATKAAAKEFAHLDISWRPIYSPAGRPFQLKRSDFRTVTGIVVIILVILIYLLPLLAYR